MNPLEEFKNQLFEYIGEPSPQQGNRLNAISDLLFGEEEDDGIFFDPNKPPMPDNYPQNLRDSYENVKNLAGLDEWFDHFYMEVLAGPQENNNNNHPQPNNNNQSVMSVNTNNNAVGGKRKRKSKKTKKSKKSRKAKKTRRHRK